MAVSGSIDFNDTRNTIITDALILCGAIEEGESPSAAADAYAGRQLDRMVKMWAADGVHLWMTDECVLHLAKSTTTYSIGTGGAHATTDGDAVKTELASDAAASATSLTVDSITGISDGDNIGIVLDDGTIDWDTVSGSPSGSTVTLTTGLTSAASTDNHVYAYTSKIDRPLRIRNVRRRGEDGNDVPIFVFSRQEYFDTPNKTGEAPVVQVYYDPQLTTGTLYCWPTPDSANDRLFMTCDLPIDDFDSSSDSPDFPQEWLDALVWNLAARVGPSYSTPEPDYSRILATSLGMYEAVKNFNVEPASVYFAPMMES